MATSSSTSAIRYAAVAALTVCIAPGFAQQPSMTKEAPTVSSPAAAPNSTKGDLPTPKKDLRLGMLIPHRTNPFWVAFARSAEQAAKNLNVDLRIVDYENREEKQI